MIQLRKEDAALKELCARRASLPEGRTAAPRPPTAKEIRVYFDNLVEMLEEEPDGAGEVLREAFASIRVVPLEENLRLEMILSEVRGNGHCGGPLFGLPQTTFRALVSSSRGSARVRVLRPKRAV